MLGYDDLIRELRRLCVENRSGTLFITTPENHSLRFVLRRGEITHVVAHGQTGMAAVAWVKQMTAGRFTYSEEAIEGGKPQSLPPTSELLAMLGGADPDPRLAPTTAAFVTTLQRNRAIIESELSEYLGPMAGLLYSELVTKASLGVGPTTLKDAIDSLAGEVPDATKAARFKDKVRLRLAANGPMSHSA